MDVKACFEKIEAAESIVVLAHKSPDGDAVGSTLGLKHCLEAKGKKVQVILPDPAAAFLHWMPGYSSILNGEEHPEQVQACFDEADLLFCLDFNDPSRTGVLKDKLETSSAFKIMIDHHESPKDFVDIMISQPEVCSTAQMVYAFIEAGNALDFMNGDAAACLYTGIMTDTGSFRFPSTTSQTHRIIGDLIDKGVENHKVHQAIYDNNTEQKLKLRGHAISKNLELISDWNVALVHLTAKEQARFDAQKGDTEGIVNIALSIEGVKMAIFVREDEGRIKISFRSKDDVMVNAFASEHFNGGGHIYAAGGSGYGSVFSTLDKIKKLIPKFYGFEANPS